MAETTAQAQMALFDDEPSPVTNWERDVARHALDDLFCHARQYRSSNDYHDLIRFVARFRFYSPFNAMLAHIQMPGASFVAPAYRWLREYRRRIKAGARPLVILQPRGPVMFVFDVSDTEANEGAPPLPREITHPFEVRDGKIGGELDLSICNAMRDGVEVAERQAGSQDAGQICAVDAGSFLKFQTARPPKPKYVWIPRRYEVLLNTKHSPEARYASLAHELAHLYCGHLGTPNTSWWPDRRGLPKATEEFEAESVCYLVCSRLGLDNPSERYLVDYLGSNAEIPPISLDCVMKATGLIEQMGRGILRPR